MHNNGKLKFEILQPLTPAFSTARWQRALDANGYAYVLDCPALGDRAVSGFLRDASAVTCNRNNIKFDEASRHVSNLLRDGWQKVDSPADVPPERPVIAALGDSGMTRLWLRRDLSGLWSYKNRLQAPQLRDDSLMPIADPARARIGYGASEILGYYAMPETGISVSTILLRNTAGPASLKLVKA